MGRSLKKGPYIDFRLEKEDRCNERIWQEVSNQNLVKKIDDLAGFRGAYLCSS